MHIIGIPKRREWPYFRATTRCGLCGSPLVEGDQVLIVRYDGHRSSPFTFGWRLALNDGYQDEKNEVEYIFWVLDQWSLDIEYLEDEPARTCHVQCIALEPPNLSLGFFRAIWYSFDPSPQELARRNRWLWSQRAQVLNNALRRFSIPLEVCHMIARSCDVHDILFSTANEFWLKTEKELKVSHQICLDADVWARYVEFQGATYIASLSNTPRSKQMSKVYSPDPARKIKSIYVADDHLGIRDVRFISSSDEEPPCIERQPGVWWSTLEVEMTSKLTVFNDGTKLRLVYPKDGQIYHSFEVPRPLHNGQYMCRLEKLIPPIIVKRMLPFVLNDPKTTGYSVCSYLSPFNILAHSSGKQNSCSYDVGLVAARDAVWLYMPIDEDDKITELWAVECDGIDHPNYTLIFRTSKGKTNVMGQYRSKDQWTRDCYRLLHRPTSEADCIYFDKSVDGIHEFAFDDNSYLPLSSPPELPQPEWQLPSELLDYMPCFYTCASLENVAEITPCKFENENFGPAIVGLLFRYRNGRRACVGQIRLDMLQPPLEVPKDSLHGLCLRFRLSDNSEANVTGVYVQGQELEDTPGPDVAHQMDLPWSGKLEWWFSSQECWVSHGDQRFPRDEEDE